MALLTRRPVYDLTSGVDTTQITRVSRMVSNYTGIPVQPNKAIVGANAFAHEAGIHQDGMLKHHETYEIMRPETVGLSDMGYELTDEELDEAFARFKELADKKKTITDADLAALITDQLYQPQEIFILDGLQVACGTMGMPTATVRMTGPDGQQVVQAGDPLIECEDPFITTEERILSARLTELNARYLGGWLW